MDAPNKQNLIESFPGLFKLFLDPEYRDFPLHRAISSVPEGWYPLLRSLFEELVKLDPDLTLYQVKSEWGTLDVHFKASTEALAQSVRMIVSKYGYLSQISCEVCGENSDKRPGSFPKCDIHKLDNLEER